MLELIAKYAVDEGLTVRPGFTVKTVKWSIELDKSGNYIGVQELGNATDKKNPGLSFPTCPEIPANEMQSGGKAHPVVESLNAVVLLCKSAEEKPTPKDLAKHAFFVASLRDLGDFAPAAALCAQALQNPDALHRIQTELYLTKAKPAEKVTFTVGGRILVEEPEVALWWSGKRQPSGNSVPKGAARCLVTGELATALPTHPKIGGLGTVGGLAIGSSLISFDKGAFGSFGLDQSANAAVSEQAAMQYRAGLNHLISRGKKLGPMIVGHWFSGRVPDEIDPFPWLTDGDDEQADRALARLEMQKLLNAIQSGEHPAVSNYRYYILAVSGSAGRVMVRDWQEGQFADLVRAVSKWFLDLSITASDGQSIIRDPKFIAVAGATVRELDDLVGPMMAALWHAAFSNSKIPLSAIRSALNRTRIDIIQDQLRPIRMGLLKAYIVRNTDHGGQMRPYLNPDHPKTAYHAGRLMAVLANIQFAALGDVNANIVQRFYPAASSTPALVFGRLIRQSQFHLNKLDTGLARYLDEKLASIWGQVQDDLPTTFSLEEQTLFALGYYQQIAQDVYERAEASAKKAKAEGRV